MKYNELVGVRPNFDDTFNIVQEKDNSWKQFITNSQFENNLSLIVRAFTASITTDLNSRKSIWVQGTYGTGKSHSTSVIKHILCDPYDDIEEFVESIYSKQLKYEISNFRQNHRVFPIVLKGRYTIVDVKDMLYVLQQEIRKALNNAGIDIAIKTDFETAINMLDNPSYNSWWTSLIDSDLHIYCRTKEEIRKKLQENDKEILNIIDRKFRNEIGGSFGTINIVEWIKDVKNQIVAQGIYDSILIIWDEFTSLLSGNECRSILNTVQDIAELSKALDAKGNPENIYLLLVTHKNMEQTDAYRMSAEEEKKLAADRFINCEYVMQPNTIYHILSSSIHKINGVALEQLMKERVDKCFPVKELIEKIADNTNGDTKEIICKIRELYPIHPYTAYLSTFVSRQLGASERSVFNYLNDSKVGFKHFLNEDVDRKLFLLSDSIWDFFLTINNVSQTNPKLAEIISRYNMHLDDVKKRGQNYVSVFKTILLLNALNSVVDSGEDSNERGLVKPNIKNICDCYAGVEPEDAINEILQFLDQQSIIVKSPEELFEVSTASLSQSDLKSARDANLQFFNEITKLFEAFPIDSRKLRDKVKKNNNQTVRNVIVEEISSTLKNSQIETKITSQLGNDAHSLVVLLIYSHEEYTEMSKLPIKQRSDDDIEDSILKLSQKMEFKDVVFVNVKEKMPAQELNRFIESYSRYNVLEKNGSTDEAKREKKNAGGRVYKWIEHIINEGKMYVAFNGTTSICSLNELANNISNKYIPFVFSSGLDLLKQSKNNSVWEEKPSTGCKSALEAILYQSTRDDIDAKLKGGTIVNLKPLLRDDNQNFIFGNDMKLSSSASETHPIVKLIREVTTVINEAQSKNPTIDLYKELSFVFKQPYGYYSNQISFSAIALAMKQYVDKIFVASEGTKISNTVMKDVIDAFFNKHFKGKDSSKLRVRFSSDEEIDLIDKLNTIFNLNKSGLVQIRWAIREAAKDKYCAPLWQLKVLTEDQTLISLVNDLFNLTIAPDQNITQTQMISLNKLLDSKKIELIQLLNNASADKKLMNKYIEMKLKTMNCSFAIDNEICDKFKEYIIAHSQEDICFLQQTQIDVLILDCYSALISNHSSNGEEQSQISIDNPESGFDNEIQKNTKEVTINKIRNYNGNLDVLKRILLKSLDIYSGMIDIINKELGE